MFQLATAFTDECDRLKDMTHLHSFSHDFHLRLLQAHVAQPGSCHLRKGYHVTSLLRDLVRHFARSPHFAVNLVMEGE